MPIAVGLSACLRLTGCSPPRHPRAYALRACACCDTHPPCPLRDSSIRRAPPRLASAACTFSPLVRAAHFQPWTSSTFPPAFIAGLPSGQFRVDARPLTTQAVGLDRESFASYVDAQRLTTAPNAPGATPCPWLACASGLLPALLESLHEGTSPVDANASAPKLDGDGLSRGATVGRVGLFLR